VAWPRSVRWWLVIGPLLVTLVVSAACASESSDDDVLDDEGTTTTATATEPDSDSTTTSEAPAPGSAEPPACFEEHLASDPVVDAQDHDRLVEGISIEVTIVEHSEEAIALELEDAGEVIGVLRIADGGLTQIEVQLFDLVDATCQRVPFTPQQSSDEVNDTRQTVVPFELDGTGYEVVFDQRGVGPIATTTFRRTS
jgi:hypothetical protein